MGHQAFAWLLLVASILAEVIGTVALRYTDGFTRPLPSLLTGACYACAIWWMAVAVRHLEVGLTYAIWAGCGTALTALVGIVWFGESAGVLRLAGLGMIVGGVVALNLSVR